MSAAPVYTEAWLSPPSDTFKFYTRTWAASRARAVVVFVHGFAEHVSRNGYNIAFANFASKGITVFAFDQRDYGKTAVEREKRGDGSYARTSWKEALADIDWAVNHVQSEFGDLPIFVLGYSMGGGFTLTTCTRSPALPVVSKLTGIIVTSPLIHQARPASRLAQFVDGANGAGVLTPDFTISVPVKAEYLSRDVAENEAFLRDPLVRFQSTLRQLNNMRNGGDELKKTGHNHWPSELPVLFIHGSEDKVTSPSASREFYEKIASKDKKYSSYKGGYHELWNEPNGVKEKLADECAEWILARSFTSGVTAKL